MDINNKMYYIDIDAINTVCRIKDSKDDKGDDVVEVNVFKYETLRTCLDKVIYEQDDSDLGNLSNKYKSISFKLCFNTLIKNKIIIECDEGDLIDE